MFFFVIISFLLILVTIWFHIRNHKSKSFSTLIVIGAGGHCREMLSIIQNFNFNKYKPVLWLLAKDDEMSLEKLLASNNKINMNNIALIRRSRHVGQSYASSILTTLLALYDSIFICYRFNPRIFICNGPGICIPPMIATKLMTCSKIVYIESFCRTKSLSLSGMIAYYIADHVLVQWESLTKKYPKSKFIGLLV